MGHHAVSLALAGTLGLWVGVAVAQPWVEQQVLIPDQDSQARQFGFATAIRSTVLAAGAPWDYEHGHNAGAAYVFVRGVSGWDLENKLAADDTSEGDNFGWRLALADDFLVVGAPFHDGFADNAGAAYVFRRINGLWEQSSQLLAPDGSAGDVFGYSVSIDNGWVAVGAPGSDSAGASAGSVYLFRLEDGDWRYFSQLTPSVGTEFESFGFSVSLSQDTLAVGADRTDLYTGSAYVYGLMADQWELQARLVPGDGEIGDQFGFAVAVGADEVVVGSPRHQTTHNDEGAAYVFARADNAWDFADMLSAADGAAGDLFGLSIALSGDRLFIGAPYSGPYKLGAAHAYDRTENGWTWTAKLTAGSGHVEDEFGTVALDADAAVIGAPGHKQGKVHIFRAPGVCPADFNLDGIVNTRDAIAFLSAWAAKDDTADINGDGTVDTRDVVAFLTAWVGGC